MPLVVSMGLEERLIFSLSHTSWIFLDAVNIALFSSSETACSEALISLEVTLYDLSSLSPNCLLIASNAGVPLARIKSLKSLTTDSTSRLEPGEENQLIDFVLVDLLINFILVKNFFYRHDQD